MDTIPAQVEPQQNISPAVPQPESPPTSVSPIKKYLPFIAIGITFLVLLIGGFTLFAGKSSKEKANPIPTVRPTATPLPAPTIPLVTQPVTVSTSSASISPVKPKIGKLAFIKEGDIYHSDLFAFSLLVKNATPAGDKLMWSPLGNFLSWRPKSNTATPNSLVIYDKEKNSSLTVKTKSDQEELVDYAWSENEKQLALLFHESEYNISVYSISSVSASKAFPLVNRSTPIKQILWPEKNTLLFLGDDGINQIDTASASAKLIINKPNIKLMKLSPDKSKLLYTVTSSDKNELNLVNLDGSENKLIIPNPKKIDMGNTNLSESILNNGFIANALWFPKGDRLMVGYNYLTTLPLVGIYDFKNSSFTAIAPFPLSISDILIHDLLLLGPRVNTTVNPPVWQVSLFTMEAGTKLGLIRTIPGATSPVYFGLYEDEKK